MSYWEHLPLITCALGQDSGIWFGSSSSGVLMGASNWIFGLPLSGRFSIEETAEPSVVEASIGSVTGLQKLKLLNHKRFYKI